MSTFLNIDCGGETVTIEKTDDGDVIFHGWDEETEMAAIELGFEPSPCFAVWNAINDDALDDELCEYFNHDCDGNPLIAEALIFAGASVNRMEPGSWTPLHSAAYGGTTDVVRVLLEAGAQTDRKSRANMTPLQVAKLWGRAGVAKVLEDWIKEHGE